MYFCVFECMKRIFTIYLLLILTFPLAWSQTRMFSISGTVLDRRTGEPVEFAAVIMKNSQQWAVADSRGNFHIGNVYPGRDVISASCLGFVTAEAEISVSGDIEGYEIYLDEDNLTLESVVVTAQENENSATTSRIIDRTALDHVQMLNVTDISGLLPGGSTSNPSLTSSQRFSIRSGGSSESGNPTFGTAVEVDGVRLSSNASFGDAAGVTTNNIASSNVESVEVISGVASVEYGDMSSGVVKVNTRKGVTPYIVTMSSNPRTKQVSASKGFNLGESRKGASRGVLNSSLEYTRAISNQMSPYTSYDRKQLSLTYSNTFSRGLLAELPLRLSAGFTGNIGGYDTKADPDTFLDTYTRQRDNIYRGNLTLDWLLSKPWITNLELKASVVYSDKQSAQRSNYSSAAGTVAIHGREEGYYVAQTYEADPDAAVNLIPRGYWYNTMYVDDRPLTYKISLKADWARQFGKVNNKVKLGGEWSADGNFGVGQYSDDMSTAPTFREYRYCDTPFMNNVAVYLEDNVVVPLGRTRLNLIAGIRNDNTIIRRSAYGTTSSWSPRFNAKYTVFSPEDRSRDFVKELSFRAGWGVSVKLPSYGILYPEPTYQDIRVFNPTTGSDGNAYYAYYILPRTIEYNSALRWQKTRQTEVGMDIDLNGYRVSLAAYYTRTLDAYRITSDYERFTYNYTDQSDLASCTIPSGDRRYEVDGRTGIVTVYDKTGTLSPQTLTYSAREAFVSKRYADNDVSPSVRYGVEWVIDFKKIKPINTTIRLDGSFYGYRSVDRNITAYYPSNATSSDGTPFKYVGYCYGGNSVSNGRETRTVNANLTITTHIPKVRLIISMKFEASLLRYSRYLSEMEDGQRSYVIADMNSQFPAENGGSIYDGQNYTITYPQYYVSYASGERRDFLTDYRWAKDNDQALYTDLSRLVTRSSYLYFFSKDYISPYFSANISVTKEIGDIASISFYANNFFNNHGQVYSTRTGNWSSVSSYIPGFFYGLSLRLKF